jgi:CubicO group peptidase (beta-lactamase class C family)
MPSALATLEDRLRTLTPTSIPGIVLLASTPNTPNAYSFATGSTSLSAAENPQPLTAASAFWLASCTKLLTSIACLQLVEQGKLHLDQPVYETLPEFGEIGLLEGWNEDGSPRLAKQGSEAAGASKKVTLRHLLTHTSGLCYDFLSPEILKWWEWKGIKPEQKGSKIREIYSAPLITGKPVLPTITANTSAEYTEI